MTRIDSILFNFSFFSLYCDGDVAAMELCNVIKDPMIGYT